MVELSHRRAKGTEKRGLGERGGRGMARYSTDWRYGRLAFGKRDFRGTNEQDGGPFTHRPGIGRDLPQDEHDWLHACKRTLETTAET